MKTYLLTAVVLGVAVFASSPALAISFSFADIPPDNGINISDSFSGELIEDSGQVLFKISNNVGSPSTVFIRQVFFDFNPNNLLTLSGFDSANSVGDVFFKPKTGGTLPQGNNLVPKFEFDVQVVADKPGTDKQGIDDGEVGAFRFDGLYANAETALLSGDLRVGIHVQGIGEDSDSYVNTVPVPEPASILLIGIGLLGLVGYSRKKKFAQKH